MSKVPFSTVFGGVFDYSALGRDIEKVYVTHAKLDREQRAVSLGLSFSAMVAYD